MFRPSDSPGGRSRAEFLARAVARIGDRSQPQSQLHERDLVGLYQSDPSTRATVIATFTPLAEGVARRYHRGEEPLEDLTQVAMVGLIKALERFDASFGSPFVAYALPTISGEVRRHYRDTGWAVHVSRADQEMAQKIAALERTSPVPLTASEAAEQLEVSVEDVVSGRLVQQALRADSLDRQFNDTDGEDDPVHAPGELDAGYEQVEARATIGQLTEGLTDREREILTRRYARDLSQREIGDHVGLSQMHVSRILRQLISDLSNEVREGG